jgi:predicted DNA-binding antitoxin AbrB/MazE fold protein
MADYPNLPARYSKGTLKLRRRLRLAEGTEVRVTITVNQREAKPRIRARRKYLYPSRPLALHTLREISGMVSLGGNALTDSEALYDSD